MAKHTLAAQGLSESRANPKKPDFQRICPVFGVCMRDGVADTPNFCAQSAPKLIRIRLVQAFPRNPHAKFPDMNKSPFPSFPPLPQAFAELQQKVNDLIKASPAAEVEKHMRTTLSSALSKMDIVTREDFDIQSQMLSRALEKLSVLEKRVAELEQTKKS